MQLKRHPTKRHQEFKLSNKTKTNTQPHYH